MLRSVVLLGALVACDGGSETAEFTVDLRIDGAEGATDPDSLGTQMCVTDAGVVYVMWLDDREDLGSESMDIWLQRSVDRGGAEQQDLDGDGDPDQTPTIDAWLPAPVKVNKGDGNVWNPDMFCNDVGVFVVWEDDRDGILENHQIYFNRSIDEGETFQDEDQLLEIDPDGMSMSLGPKITGTEDGDLFVTWYDNLNGAYDILMSSSGDAGENFRDPVRVDDDQPAGAAYSARPEIAVGDNALDIWITWEDSRDDKADIYFAYSNNGGTTFGDGDQRIDGGDEEGSADSFEPELCADAGNITVVWHDARSGQFRDVFMNYSANSGVDWFPTAVRMDTDAPGFANSLFPTCIQVANTSHVVWEDSRNGNYDLFYREVVDGIPGEEVRVDVGTTAGFANSLHHQMAMDLETLVVAWEDSRNDASESGYDDLYYNFKEAGGDWSEEGADDNEGDLRIDSMYDGQSYKIDLSIAVLGGELYAAWTDGRNGTSDIFFQRLAIGSAALPPPIEAAQNQ